MQRWVMYTCAVRANIYVQHVPIFTRSTGQYQCTIRANIVMRCVIAYIMSQCTHTAVRPVCDNIDRTYVQPFACNACRLLRRALRTCKHPHAVRIKIQVQYPPTSMNSTCLTYKSSTSRRLRAARTCFVNAHHVQGVSSSIGL